MNSQPEAESWVVETWSRIFGWLGRLSLFSLLRKVVPSLVAGRHFVEYYVVGNTALALATLAVVTWRRDAGETPLLLLMMCFGVLRTFEIFVYQVNVLLFDQYRTERAGHKYAVKGYRRIVLLLLHNCLEIICWFGVVYMWFYRSGHIVLPPGSPDPTFFRVFHESLLTMFSLSPAESLPASDAGLALLSLQAMIGLFMTLMVLARFIAVLPTPESKDERETAP
jgi:hypothetical protein